MMAADDAEEYTQALGQVVAGGWRQVALGDRLGVPQSLGLSTREWVEGRLGGYIRLSVPERREAVEELTANGHSQRETADILGVHEATVSRDLAPSLADASPPDDEQGESVAVLADASPPLSEAEIAERERERIRHDAIERDADRLRKFISGWFTFSTLDTNSDRADVLDALAEPDRQQLDNITRRISWKT